MGGGAKNVNKTKASAEREQERKEIVILQNLKREVISRKK
jgi:hypothetical protein